MKEIVVSDSGVIKVIVRELRDNREDIPADAKPWYKHLYLEAWRAGVVIAGVRNEVDDRVLPQYEKDYWYSKTRMCMLHGLALGVFVGGRSSTTEYAFGAPVSAHLVLPDVMNSKQALLLHTMIESFGGKKAQDLALQWCREWAESKGRKLVRFEDRFIATPTVRWISP